VVSERGGEEQGVIPPWSEGTRCVAIFPAASVAMSAIYICFCLFAIVNPFGRVSDPRPCHPTSLYLYNLVFKTTNPIVIEQHVSPLYKKDDR